jgi:hypothetical protein
VTWVAKDFPAGSPTHRLLKALEEEVQHRGRPVDPEIGTPQAWWPLLDRRDDDTARLVRGLRKAVRSEWLPFGTVFVVDPRTPHGAEWAGRLVPSPPTAAACLIADRADAGTVFVDPITHAPALRGTDGQYRTVQRRRLPAATGLAEIAQDRVAWLRTRDGLLHPVRRRWEADLVALLLHDVTADNAQLRLPEAPPALSRLIESIHPHGTLTRATLESAVHHPQRAEPATRPTATAAAPQPHGLTDCPACAEPIAPDDTYCETCGGTLPGEW